MQKHARKPDALALAARKRIAQLSNRRVEPLRQTLDQAGERRLAAGLGKLLRRRVGTREQDVLAHRAGEQVCLLRHVALARAQRRRVHAANIDSRNAHHAARGVPETHEQLAQRRLAAAALAGQMDDGAGGDVEVHVLEHRGFAIGEIDPMGARAREGAKIAAAGNLGRLRRLVEQVEHARTAGERLLQGGAQIRHRDDRPERRHERGGCHERLLGADFAREAKRAGSQHHAHVEREHQPVSGRHEARGAALQLALGLRVGGHTRVQLAGAVGRAPELKRLAQATQTVEHEGVHVPEAIAQLPGVGSRRLRRHPRHRNAHDQVTCQRQQREHRRDGGDEGHHARRDDQRDERRRKRVRVENFEQLHVGGDERNQIALAAALQLRGRQGAQLAEDTVAHECQNLERQVMVANLLAVMQRPAGHAAHRHQHKGRGERRALRQAGGGHERLRAEHGQEDGGEKSRYAKHHGRYHHRDERAHQAHESQHDGKVRAAPRGCDDGRFGSGRRVVARGDVTVRSRRRSGHASASLLGFRREALKLSLLAPQACIGATVFQQLIMRSRFGNRSRGQHVDSIGRGHRRQAMRDHDDRAGFRQLVDDADDGLLAFGIHVGSCLVEDVDGRVMQKRTGESQALTLPSGKVAALLGNRRVEPARCAHETVDAAACQSVPQRVIVGLRISHQQIRAHRAGKQVAGKRHHCHRAGNRGARGLAERHAAKGNRTRKARVAPAQDARKGGFPASRFAHDARERPDRRLEVNLRKHRALPVVGIRHVAAHHVSRRRIDHARALRGLRRIQDGEHLVRHGHAVHSGVEVRPQGTHGDEEVGRQEDDGECGEKRHVARGVLHKRHDDTDCGATIGEDVHDGHRVQLHGQKLHGGAAELLGLIVHALVALGIGLIDFQRGKALQVLQKRAAQIGVGAPVFAHHAAGNLLNGDDGRGDERHAHEQRHGRRQAQGRQAAEQRDGREQRVKQLRKVLAEVAFQLLAALDADLHGLGRGNLFGIGRSHAHELVVHRAAHRPLRGARRSLTRTLGSRKARDTHDDGRGGHARQANLAFHFGSAVHQLPDEQPDGDHHGDIRQQRDPLPRHAGGDIFESLRHHRRQTFAEHGSPLLRDCTQSRLRLSTPAAHAGKFTA